MRCPARRRYLACLTQLAQLGLTQAAIGAGRQRPQSQRAKSDAPQLKHRMTDRLAHASHLAVAAFAERQLELVASAPNTPYSRGRSGPICQRDTGAQDTQRTLADWRTGNTHAVGAGHFVARMS